MAHTSAHSPVSQQSRGHTHPQGSWEVGAIWGFIKGRRGECEIHRGSHMVGENMGLLGSLWI